MRALRDAIGERGPFDEFEDEGRDAVGFLEAVDAADVWMVQRRKELGLAAEAGDARRCRA